MYTPAVWADFVAGGTPINAAALQHIEQGIADGDVTNPASPAAVLQSATFAPIGETARATGVEATKLDKWQPLTAYVSGWFVTSPQGDTVSAKAGHTSGATFTAANWNPAPYISGFGVNVKAFGATGDGATDDTVAIQNAIAAASALGGAKVIFPAGDYRANNLTVPDYVVLEGVGGGFARFGPQITGGGSYGWRKAAVRIYRLSDTTTDPVVYLLGAGSGVKNIQLEGANAPGTILQVEGFETKVEDVRVINGGGIGIDVFKANNNRWKNIYVDNCGSATLPGMKVWSKTGAGGANETNSFDIYGLTIERCVNVALDIAYNPANLADTQYWAEFVRIVNLHIESSSTNVGTGAGVGNVDPLIRVGNIRSLHLVAPFVYGGPSYLMVHNQQYNRTYGNGGIRIDDGTFIGSDTATGVAATPSLFHLITGDDFELNGRPLRYTVNAVVIEATYSNSVAIAPTCYPAPTISDARTAMTLSTLRGNHEVTGQLRSSGTTPTLVNSASITAVLLAGSTDTAGKVKFGTGASPAAGVLTTLTFSKAYSREPTVILSSGVPVTQSMGISATSTTTTMTIRATNVPTASQSAGTYEIDYLVIG